MRLNHHAFNGFLERGVGMINCSWFPLKSKKGSRKQTPVLKFLLNIKSYSVLTVLVLSFFVENNSLFTTHK